ncbi:class I SAM-dependent methyltransferase [Spongiactinospora sp. TRM90649]|uniref:class I SAM-dependent methyltransferase n=1 Tax=Spongiactinospora sp. TRM90649 TaxID=3031114 RepID=UPI0023F6C6B9|nr:class I SAM-dependent methyltransferase [Spongiactinospora sp. TRM90649]MDF5752831.1 methyltransferase domain-containing protein [Spongiactinospora sp. TRM90649]
MSESSSRDVRLRRYWDGQAGTYDRRIAFAEERFFGDTRPWLCGQAVGEVLEIAVGTGLNLPHYPEDVQVTGVEWSSSMLEVARRRARELGRQAVLEQGDARELCFPDGSFDTVVCTFALCGIPSPRTAFAEMTRVLRPGGLLLLADHVGSTVWPVWALQALMDAFSVPTSGEHFRRRPLRWVRAAGFDVTRHERFKLGIIERLAARKPGMVIP